MNPDVLVVDDDETFRERLASSLRARGHEVRTAPSYEQALAMAQERPPAGALVDLRMPGCSGLDLVRALRALEGPRRIVVLTGYGSIGTAVEATKLGADGYLQKPTSIQEILAALKGEPIPPEGTSADTPSLARVEWEHIQRVLAECQGNVTVASQRLGIDRRTLQRKLHKYPPSR
jgi:two-component system response regulator RegA